MIQILNKIRAPIKKETSSRRLIILFLFSPTGPGQNMGYNIHIQIQGYKFNSIFGPSKLSNLRGFYKRGKHSNKFYAVTWLVLFVETWNYPVVSFLYFGTTLLKEWCILYFEPTLFYDWRFSFSSLEQKWQILCWNLESYIIVKFSKLPNLYFYISNIYMIKIEKTEKREKQ